METSKNSIIIKSNKRQKIRIDSNFAKEGRDMGMAGKGFKWLKRNVGGTLSGGGKGMRSPGQGMLKIRMKALKMPKMRAPRRRRRRR